jgi:hypothetical protein
MSVTLDAWQERLERHFTQLAASRPVADFPIFALEHGLSAAGLDEIGILLRAQLRAHRPLRPHWLVWVVYAAELGYAYDGQEFWQSFEDQTPYWKEQGTRRQLRGWYRQFQKAYGGIIPTGPWAEHFSIIAWPITHAILPRDLQGQFARLLYTLRFDLASLADSSAAVVGDFLSARGSGGSSRFDNLLEQTSLTGRLVFALAQQDSRTAIPPIYPPTLARITGDLELRQNSRDWLNDARAVLRDARVRAGSSLAPGRGASGSQRDSGSGTARSSQGLVARQSPAGDWTLGIAYPDIGRLLQATGVSPTALDKASVLLADRPELPMPARALLTVSGRERPIHSLADAIGKPLAVLKPAVPALSDYLSHFRIPAASRWLLRLQADGIARLVRGNHVRARGSYLLVATSAVAENSAQDLGLRLQQTRTQGALIYLMEVPDQLGRYYLQALARLNVGYALRTTIEPAGLVPRWDASDGSTVWLPNEEIVVRLSPDTPVREFTIGINGAGWTKIPASAAGDTIVTVGSLPIGRHLIEVRAVADSAVSSRGGSRLEPEQLAVRVRPPQPWTDGVREQAGFRVMLRPANARIADLASGAAMLEVIGPPDRLAIVEAETFDTNGHAAQRAPLGHMTLPATPRALRQIGAKLGKEPLSELIQASPRIDISVRVEELGRCAVSLRQTIDPLRWKLDASSARLVDEAGADEEVTIERYDIRSPGHRVVISRQQCHAGLIIEPPGALLTAKFNGRRYSAVASIPGKLASFTDLAIHITVGSRQDTIHAVRRLIPLYRLWIFAKPLGTLAPLRKRMVLDTIHWKIASLVCGPEWAARLRSAISGSSAQLDRLQREVGPARGFAYRMRSTNWHQPEEGLTPLGAFKKCVATYRITNDPALPVLAFHLAFEPDQVRFDSSGPAADVLDRLGRNLALVRGAYLARAVRDRHSNELLSEEAA